MTTTVAPANSALHEAVEGLIQHALTLAGMRLQRKIDRSKRWHANRLPPEQVHVYLPVTREQLEQHDPLKGAFRRVPQVAARHGLDPDCLTEALTDYVRALLLSGQQHEWELVPRLLAQVICTEQQ